MLIWILFSVAGLAVLGLILYIVGAYNTLVRMRRSIDKNFGNIDLILQQRHDELPKLVNACQGYMKHEKELLEKVTALREGYRQAENQDAKVLKENEINMLVGQLWARAEQYPDLKADRHFLQIQGRVSDLENTIADRRELFNESVTNQNILIVQFPTNLVAKRFGYGERPLFEIDGAARTDKKNLFNT